MVPISDIRQVFYFTYFLEDIIQIIGDNSMVVLNTIWHCMVTGAHYWSV